MKYCSFVTLFVLKRIKYVNPLCPSILCLALGSSEINNFCYILSFSENRTFGSAVHCGGGDDMHGPQVRQPAIGRAVETKRKIVQRILIVVLVSFHTMCTLQSSSFPQANR